MTSNIVSCIICKKETTSKGIFTHFLHAHDKEWQDEWKISNTKTPRKNTKQTLEKEERINQYNLNPNICICGKPKPWLTKKNKYCSASCAAFHTNISRGKRTIETIEKISNSLIDFCKTNKRDYSNRSKTKTKCVVCFHKCTMCSNIILSKSSKPGRKTCSRECQIHASVGVRNYVNGRRKNIYYTHKSGQIILLESSWELKLAEYMDKNNIDWERPKPINWIDLESKSRLYYPDFYLPKFNLYLDPKNPWVISQSLDKMKIIKSLIPILYGDIKILIEELSKL